MLPVLVRKVPRAHRELRLDLVEGTGGGAPAALARAAARVVCRRSFWGPAAWIGERLPGGLRVHPLFDFVRLAAYLDGYRQARSGGSRS
jgi:hypothetical protein